MSTSTLEPENNSSIVTQSESSLSQHLLPSVITTVGFIALIVILVVVLKICGYIRRKKLIARSLERMFTSATAPQPQRRAGNEEIEEEEEDEEEGCVCVKSRASRRWGSQFCDHPCHRIHVRRETAAAQIMENSHDGWSMVSSSSAHSLHRHLDTVAAGDYVAINPRHKMKVEVEVHPPHQQLSHYAADKDLSDSDVDVTTIDISQV